MTTSEVTRRAIVSSAAACAVLRTIPARAAALEPASTGSAAGFGTAIGTLYTGSHSHWLQPWRDMVATRSLAAIRNGIGLNCDTAYPSSLAMFASHGFTQVRVAVLWSMAAYGSPDTIAPADNPDTVDFLQAAQAAGLRPLVLLQAFDQGPCPSQRTQVTASAAVAAADTTITVSSASGLVSAYTGLTGYFTDPAAASLTFVSANQVMAATLVTGISGDTLTLSKPVGIAIPAGATLVFDTLLYKPWSKIGTADYDNTMSGWLSYVGAVSAFLQTVLGTAGATDLGFDLEIWNETSFGSDFLDINNYYAQQVVAEVTTNGIPAVIPDIVAQTSAYVLANPSQFGGVRVSDGFASVSPMQASSTEPGAVSALSKHPYPSPQTFPAADPGSGGLDAQGNATGVIPSYTIYTHEYFSTGINPFTLARDITTVANDFGGITHGQNGRTLNGTVSPVSVWLTEYGTAPEGISDPSAIAYLTTKGTLRGLFFNLGIGAERCYVYTGVGDTTQLALVPSSAPTTPTQVLTAIANALAFIGGGIAGDQSGTLASFTYQVSVVSGTPATLFTGNGTSACPDFVQPADYVLIPVQVTPTRIAFLHWFTALDMRENPANGLEVALLITGFPSAAAATVSAYDPISGSALPATVWGQNSDAIALGTYAADWPVIILVDQG